MSFYRPLLRQKLHKESEIAMKKSDDDAKTEFKLSQNKRRSELGLEISKNFEPNFCLSGDDCLGNIEMDNHLVDNLPLNDFFDVFSWQIQRRSKQFLSMRVPTEKLILDLDLRRDWNVRRGVSTLLDLFPSLKYSYSSLCRRQVDGVVSVGGEGNPRISRIARSHSIRLDPIDSTKELFKYRCRILKILDWAYQNNLVPVMMTLTTFHRWHNLAGLCRVLQNSWSRLFTGKSGLKRKEYLGLRGYIRRTEETFNDGGDANTFNSGWHPHYHVILFVPRDKLTILSAYESELKSLWVKLLQKYFFAEFGEEIPQSYLPSLYRHGLVLSRYQSDDQAVRYGRSSGKMGDLFEVKDGRYLAKIMGMPTQDHGPFFGVESELTVVDQKKSKTPFDLLRGEVTANVVDLWCEYAIATKNIPCFTFSNGLQKEVDEFFQSPTAIEKTFDYQFPSVGDGSVSVADAVPAVKGTASADGLSGSSESLYLTEQDYHWLYRHFQLGNLLGVVKRVGVASAKIWLYEKFRISAVDDLLVRSFDVGDLSYDELVKEYSQKPNNLT